MVPNDLTHSSRKTRYNEFHGAVLSLANSEIIKAVNTLMAVTLTSKKYFIVFKVCDLLGNSVGKRNDISRSRRTSVLCAQCCNTAAKNRIPCNAHLCAGRNMRKCYLCFSKHRLGLFYEKGNHVLKNHRCMHIECLH